MKTAVAGLTNVKKLICNSLFDKPAISLFVCNISSLSALLLSSYTDIPRVSGYILYKVIYFNRYLLAKKYANNDYANVFVILEWRPHTTNHSLSHTCSQKVLNNIDWRIEKYCTDLVIVSLLRRFPCPWCLSSNTDTARFPTYHVVNYS